MHFINVMSVSNTSHLFWFFLAFCFLKNSLPLNLSISKCYLAFSLCCCCRRSLSCQMSRVPGLLRSSRVGLEGDRDEDEVDDGSPTSTWRLDLERRIG